MSIASSVRTTVRGLLNSLGKTAYLYSYSSATVTTNEEGDETIVWATPTTIIGVSSSNYKYRKLAEKMGIESNPDDRVFIIRDDVTVDRKDKLVIGTDDYEVVEIKNLDPIETGIIIAKRLELKKKVGY